MQYYTVTITLLLLFEIQLSKYAMTITYEVQWENLLTLWKNNN